jgi:hypothetical protein
MKSFTIKLFPTAAYIIKIERWEEYKDYLLTAIKDQKDPAYRPSEGYYTDYGLEQSWRKTIWEDYLEPQIRPLLDGTNTKLQDIWAQQYINQASFSAHRHQPVGYSAVFYASFDPKVHSATSLFRPFVDPNDIKNTQDVYTPEVVEGDLLVFPSWMLHQALPSNSQVPRTIIAFNLEPK